VLVDQVQRHQMLLVEVDQIQFFHQLHQQVVEVVDHLVVAIQLVCVLELPVDQEVEDQLHSHHPDPLVVDQEILPL
tara:strand:+ start:74 stop:301 length:228 start_codon:yes stop_codon:yes gene_type:complete